MEPELFLNTLTECGDNTNSENNGTHFSKMLLFLNKH